MHATREHATREHATKHAVLEMIHSVVPLIVMSKEEKLPLLLYALPIEFRARKKVPVDDVAHFKSSTATELTGGTQLLS